MENSLELLRLCWNGGGKPRGSRNLLSSTYLPLDWHTKKGCEKKMMKKERGTLHDWLAKNINKKIEKSALPSGPGSVGMEILPSTTASSNLSNPVVSIVGGGTTNAFDEILKATPPALVAFLASLPAVEGPAPDVDIVLSICLQGDIPAGYTGKSGASPAQLSGGPAPSLSDVSGSSKAHPILSGSSFKPTRDRQSGKRKDLDRQEDDETVTVQSQPLPRDVFRIRQIQKARAGPLHRQDQLHMEVHFQEIYLM
ncbi:cleavage stimulation factor subunit 77 [Quercus suber]|uniref:Cleavage stimulation factor subunit 77 n=1 Tax=Quercus suber TaxID=58331 RepID=A0AAW0KMI2_QUESU